MPVEYLWTVQCRNCGDWRTIKGGPRGHGSPMCGEDCTESPHGHSTKAVRGPRKNRELKREGYDPNEVSPEEGDEIL